MKKVFTFRLDEGLVESLRKKNINLSDLFHEAMRKEKGLCPLCGGKRSRKNKSL